MKAISLKAQWKLSHFQTGSCNVHSPEELKDSGIPLLEAAVPGNVELDLWRAGKIENPYTGSNVLSLRDLEADEWWYLGQFSTPPELEGKQVELVFGGVDCLATYWLNGAELGETSNMFIEHRFDVTRHLRADAPNELAVRIKSPVVAARNYQYDPAQCAMSVNWDQLWIRKAPHSYGWDIMPRALSAGIWRSVDLQVHEPTEWVDIYYYTLSANENSATLGLYYQFRTDKFNLEDFSIRVAGKCQESQFFYETQILFTTGEISISIPRPDLWWPRGYGDPNLYTVIAELLYKGNVAEFSFADRV